MCVGDLTMIVGIEIGRMQNFWIGKMTGEIIIQVNTGIDTRGTRLTKGSRTESVITEVIKGSRTEIVITEVIMGSRIAELAVKPSDVVKTAFVTKNGTFAYKCLPFGLSGVDPNFQKSMDIILRPVLGSYMNMYMEGVIIASTLFAHQVEHLRELFRLLQETGLVLNKDKCNFGCEKLKFWGLVISKDGITTDESKVKPIIEMKPPKHSREVTKNLGINQWYQKFIKDYADLCEALCQLQSVEKIVEHRDPFKK
ncbi:retrovirus-related Pol polyprotein from transposon opus [Trichonephila clavipes]|nr:retrovirus-related Pol polyprotein from transposon opus [Trichonephila clavipes]